MKIRSVISVVLMVLSLALPGRAQTPSTAAECNKPLSESSKTDIVCNPDDKNLNKRAVGSSEGTVPEVENPGGCRECYANRFDKRLNEKNTVAPAATGGGDSGETGTNSKTRK